MKPLDKNGGKGIIIGSDAKIIEAEKEFPVLVQEFIDTSDGILGTSIKKVHDFRMVLVNGEIVLAVIRTPLPNSLLAGIAGSDLYDFLLADIPATVREFAKKIDKKFVKFRRAYSIDIGFENKKPKLIELNSQPGLSPNMRGLGFVRFKEKLADALLSF